MSELRQEIIETEKARTDFLKWKLIGVAALGATGLGLTQSPRVPGASLLLALIPPVCFYVDLVCWHSSLRILVIGRFLGRSDQATAEQVAYEKFAERARHMGGKKKTNVFALEDWALVWSTCVLSLLIALAGAALPSLDPERGFVDAERAALIVSGLVGFLLALLGRLSFARRVKLLNDLPIDRP
jgi:hypothetical protein